MEKKNSFISNTLFFETQLKVLFQTDGFYLPILNGADQKTHKKLYNKFFGSNNKNNFKAVYTIFSN